MLLVIFFNFLLSFIHCVFIVKITVIECYNYCISSTNNEFDYTPYVSGKNVDLTNSYILMLIGCSNISKTTIYRDVKANLDIYNVLYKELVFYRICIFNDYLYFKK